MWKHHLLLPWLTANSRSDLKCAASDRISPHKLSRIHQQNAHFWLANVQKCHLHVQKIHILLVIFCQWLHLHSNTAAIPAPPPHAYCKGYQIKSRRQWHCSTLHCIFVPGNRVYVYLDYADVGLLCSKRISNDSLQHFVIITKHQGSKEAVGNKFGAILKLMRD